jgi:hypothetical protein
VYAGPQDESSNINIQKPSNPIIYTQLMVANLRIKHKRLNILMVFITG